MIEKRAFTSS